MTPAPSNRAGFRPLLALALVLTAVASVLVVGEAGAAFPGENGKIAFFRQGDIYTINPDGSDEVNLTGAEASGGDPNWSPDGQRIVYESIVDGNFDIYVMNADGSGQTRLTEGPAFDSRPAWSADGSRIFFQSTRDGNFEVYVMDADGGNQTRLTNSPTFDGMVAASPDGSTVAFTTDRDGNQEIYSMNVDGSGQTNLTNSPENNTDANYSPDGSQIVYTTVGTGGGDISVMNAAGSGPTNLTNTSAVNETSPAWSPDGTQITFVAPVEGGIGVFVMDADGSDPMRITDATGTERDPDWQPLAAEPPPDGDLVVAIDDEVVTNATRGQVTGEITCAVGERFVVQLDLSQGSASAQGTARGSCSGSAKPYTIGFATSGAALEAGAADACVTARSGTASTRTVTDQDEVCEEVTVVVRNR